MAGSADTYVYATLGETLDRIERCYDAIPRVNGARVEELGPLALFLRDGPGWQRPCIVNFNAS